MRKKVQSKFICTKSLKNPLEPNIGALWMDVATIFNTYFTRAKKK